MEPLYIILIALVLIIVLLAIFTAITYLILSLFRQPSVAEAVREMQGKKRK